ncbi:MAG: B12-binding domain-containing radical SAM protein [Cellulosilyticaceae bacterium]
MKVLFVSLNAKYVHSSLALRYIKDYCQEYKNNTKILELTINHDENQMIRQIYAEKPDVIGFSCYIWNMADIKKLIPTLKKILPQTEIILGGPEVSYHSTELMEELDIDMIMEGEGEEIWDEYLSYKTSGMPLLKDIDGIIYKDRLTSQVVINKARKLIDLSKLPFVYDNLDGLEHRIIYYEASRGCPFNCQYCLSSIEKGVRFLPVDRVKQELQYFLDNRIMQVKFVDRTFNTKKKYAMEIWQYIIENDNNYTNFHFEIAAELLDDEMIEALKTARPGLIQFEIGVQSTNIEVLTTIKRRMPFEDIASITNKIKSLGNIHQHLDLIAGLPLEDYSSFRQSFNDVISLRPEQFQLGFLKLLKGSGLRKDASKYGIVYKEEAPYEVLYTDYLSYDEMIRLHNIEEMLERYYNSERFKTSLEYLYTLFDTPFDFYQALANYWEEKGYDKVSHKKASYYIYLVEFVSEFKNANLSLVKELVKFDWFTHEFIKEVPNSLVTLSQDIYKEKVYDVLKDDEYMQQVSKAASVLPIRQRVRKVHIEYFTYAIYQAIQIGNYNTINILDQPQPILFDYTYASNGAKTVLVEG